jgi:hypothetical protein
LVGFVLGALAAIGIFWATDRAIADHQVQNIRHFWNSSGKSSQELELILRHCGRALLQSAAFRAAKIGSTEEQLRDIFGPPDLVLIGYELDERRARHHRLAQGAYHYKLGRCGYDIEQIHFGIFVLEFDKEGLLLHALGLGLRDDHPLANQSSDTRTERRIKS